MKLLYSLNILKYIKHPLTESFASIRMSILRYMLKEDTGE